MKSKLHLSFIAIVLFIFGCKDGLVPVLEKETPGDPNKTSTGINPIQNEKKAFVPYVKYIVKEITTIDGNNHKSLSVNPVLVYDDCITCECYPASIGGLSSTTAVRFYYLAPPPLSPTTQYTGPSLCDNELIIDFNNETKKVKLGNSVLFNIPIPNKEPGDLLGIKTFRAYNSKFSKTSSVNLDTYLKDEKSGNCKHEIFIACDGECDNCDSIPVESEDKCIFAGSGALSLAGDTSGNMIAAHCSVNGTFSIVSGSSGKMFRNDFPSDSTHLLQFYLSENKYWRCMIYFAFSSNLKNLESGTYNGIRSLGAYSSLGLNDCAIVMQLIINGDCQDCYSVSNERQKGIAPVNITIIDDCSLSLQTTIKTEHAGTATFNFTGSLNNGTIFK